ncbi:hypothetical protein BDK51DRAFT_39008 [Blyttiomyces helicus]|uniref:SH3 domain-containing protein n=1 Tax=Blyttiomyces helicus TaxID=388810 RepID=A0A4P9WCX3_9FUNG|nr:hypothetical protein BDK51DRAFT_39008 [Blyttiomyces helicus]|eukprot:RKO90529.1 hypothetical protein BDK51DRAFT_39008 [Blyttiomyces helicus]
MEAKATRRWVGIKGGRIIDSGDLSLTWIETPTHPRPSDFWSIDTTTYVATKLLSSGPSAPTARVYFNMFTLDDNTVGVFGGETTYDAAIGDWVAGDAAFYSFQEQQDSWAASLPSLVPPTVPATPQPATPQPTAGNTANITTSTSSSSSDQNTASIIGGVLGGFALLLVMIAWGVAIKHARRRTAAERYNASQAGSSAPNSLPKPAGPPQNAKSQDTIIDGDASTRTLDRPGAPRRAPTAQQGSDPAAHAGDMLASTGASAAFAAASGTSQGAFRRVLWAHAPMQPDELEAKPGDRVEVKRVFADGWVLVINHSQDGRIGFIPRNILKEGEDGDDDEEEEEEQEEVVVPPVVPQLPVSAPVMLAVPASPTMLLMDVPVSAPQEIRTANPDLIEIVRPTEHVIDVNDSAPVIREHIVNMNNALSASSEDFVGRNSDIGV